VINGIQRVYDSPIPLQRFNQTTDPVKASQKNIPAGRVILLMILIGMAGVFIFLLTVEKGLETDRPDLNSGSVENVPGRDAEISPLATPIGQITASFGELEPISSLLVSQHSEIIAEEYFGSMRADRGHNIKSASKSILSILTGIAIDQGYLEGTHQTLEEFFPDYFANNPDSVKAGITIEDLLTMRSGLASTSRSNYGRWVTSPNWIEYVLDRPLQGLPGKDRIYSTGTTHLLAVILHKATGMNTLQFANKYLFDRMEIQVTGWDRDPQGYYLGGNNMAMRPRDMIKIGQLMIDVGEYEGEQLVSREWLVSSVIPVTGRRAGIDDYGYLWFTRSAGGNHMVYAFGSGGQYIMILPELEAVISVTTFNNGTSDWDYRRQLFNRIDREIIPWLEASWKTDGDPQSESPDHRFT